MDWIAYVGLAAAAVLGLVAVARKDPTLVWIAVAFLIVVVARSDIVDAWGMMGQVIRLGAGFVTLGLLSVVVLRRPVRLARIMRLRQRDPEWEFDGLLFRLLESFNDAAGRAVSARDPVERRRSLERARDCVQRLRTVRAPTEDWARLAREYAALSESRLNAYEEGVEADGAQQLNALGDSLSKRWQNLRREYRQRAPGQWY